MKISRFYLGIASILLVLSLFTLAAPGALRAADATDEQIAAAVAGGQKYLFDTFVDSGATGYWDGYTRFSATCLAVAALIETGKYGDAAYAAKIDKAIVYIKQYVQANGGIYTGSVTYENGLAIVALSLYGQVTTQDAAYKTMIQNALNYFIAGQGSDGGWTYSPCSSCTGGDLSNTQFAVMGMWYGSKYLGLPIKGQTWATKLLNFLDTRQNATDGGFGYTDKWSYFNMTAAGLWCLAMIDEGTISAGSRAERAIGWFNTNYGTELFSNSSNGWGYYGLYGAAKALTASLGTTNPLGVHNWVTDLRNVIYKNSTAVTVPQTTPPTANSWSNNLGAPVETPMVLMSLAFAASINTISRNVTAPVGTDIPIANQGFVTLKLPGGGPQFSGTSTQGNVGADALGNPITKPPTVTLPIGSFDFTITSVPVGGTVVLTIECPAGALDKTNPSGFLNPDGTIKSGLNWFKIQGGAWKNLPTVPIKLVPVGGPYTAIEVTLRDGGPEDLDHAANGVIVDPGAPGTGGTAAASTASGAADSGSGSGFCFIATAAFGSYMAPDVIVLREFRDKYLLTNPLGSSLVDMYYHVSPPLAQFIAQHESLRLATRVALTPIIYGVKYPLWAAAFFIVGGFMIGIFIYRRKVRYA